MTVLLINGDLVKSHNKGYTKKDGTVVPAFDDKRVRLEKPATQWILGAQAPGVKAPQHGPSGGAGHASWPYAPKDGTKPVPQVFHPKPDDKGQQVGIHAPHNLAVAGLADADAIATITPGCALPPFLNGVPFASWTPPDGDQWDYVDGQKDDLVEPHLNCPAGKEPATGLVIVEPDGRAWVVSPTNRFGGYQNTFPKGKVEEDLSFQANAIKEAWEEAGIKANIVGLLGDVERSTSVTRYYLARRVAGHPGVDMGWESQAVHLVPIAKLNGFMDSALDRQVVQLLG